MPVIDVTTFTGMRPAVAGHLLEQNEAQSAFNVDTSTGVLSPCMLPGWKRSILSLRAPSFVHDARASGKGLVWRVYPDKRQFVESPVAGDRIRAVHESPNASDSSTDTGTNTPSASRHRRRPRALEMRGNGAGRYLSTQRRRP